MTANENVLVVVAHPDPRSVNGALRDVAVDTLTAAGHHVETSDLYASRFKAVDADHFAVRDDAEYLRVDASRRPPTRDMEPKSPHRPMRAMRPRSLARCRTVGAEV